MRAERIVLTIDLDPDDGLPQARERMAAFFDDFVLRERLRYDIATLEAGGDVGDDLQGHRLSHHAGLLLWRACVLDDLDAPLRDFVTGAAAVH